MARIRINTGSRTEEKPYMVLICIFCKIDKAKKVNRVSKIRVFMLVRYVLKEFFVSFPWRLEMWKVGQNAPFFKWAPFWNLISKKKKKKKNYIFQKKIT